LKLIQIVFPTELDYLHRHGQAASAEAVNQLCVVFVRYKLVGGGLNHLLANKGTTAAFDEVEVGVDLVGVVDGETEDEEGDAEEEDFILCALGGRDANDVNELAGGEECAKLGDDEGGGGAGAGAGVEDHASLDELHGLVRGESLEVVPGEGDGTNRERMGHGAQVKGVRGVKDKVRGGVVVCG